MSSVGSQSPVEMSIALQLLVIITPDAKQALGHCTLSRHLIVTVATLDTPLSILSAMNMTSSSYK